MIQFVYLNRRDGTFKMSDKVLKNRRLMGITDNRGKTVVCKGTVIGDIITERESELMIHRRGKKRKRGIV